MGSIAVSIGLGVNESPCQRLLNGKMGRGCEKRGILAYLRFNGYDVRLMRIPITKYGWPQVVIMPAGIVVAMAVCLSGGGGVLAWLAVVAIEAVLLILLVFVLSFFRDPKRDVPADSSLLLSPADGKVVDIKVLDGYEGFDGPVLRIGIFLSVFDPHINRAPCDVKIEDVKYRPGKFKDARDPQAGKVNESNDLTMLRVGSRADRIVVRQISGAIARRIVCAVGQGDSLARGEKFGMIKFGSRTELYIPARDDIECACKVGDKVKAGLTILGKYK